jgi:hypothetical protein
METYENQYGEDKSAEQTRKASEALEFHHHSGPFIDAPRQSDVVKNTTPATPTTDATLNFGGGNAVISSQNTPGEIPFTAELARAAGVDGERIHKDAPSKFGVTLTPVASNFGEGNLNMTDLIRGGKR